MFIKGSFLVVFLLSLSQLSHSSALLLKELAIRPSVRLGGLARYVLPLEENRHVQIDFTSSRSFSASSVPEGQIFGIATYDAAFKHVLSDHRIRLGFLNTFVPESCIESAELLDSSLNPIKGFTSVRKLLNAKKTFDLMERIRNGELYIIEEGRSSGERHDEGTKLIREIAHHFKDIKGAFPRPLRASQMDFACRLSDGDYALAEVQVVPQDYWDMRALAYAALFFGRQLREGDRWHDLKRVIAINILGGGRDEVQHWPETPKDLIRHYKMVDTLNPSNTIDGIELVQCSIMNEGAYQSTEMKEWIDLFRNAHKKTWDDVDAVKTPEVRAAYGRLVMEKFPEEVKKSYVGEDFTFKNSSQYIGRLLDEENDKARFEEKREIARNLIGKIPDSEIIEATGLTLQEIAWIRESI